MQKTRKTYYANGTDIGDAIIHRGIYYLNGAEATAQDWDNMPSDWSDIRKDCPKNSIALYAGHKADYSQYDNLGFTATCVGGYKVYIDGNVYGSYSSGSTCTITWSSLALTTGDDITTPSALKAHKIWIEPATSGNNITDFTGARVASGSGYEDQGILWVHFNIGTSIHFSFGAANNYRNRLIEAITSKNNKINVNSLSLSCHYCSALTYTPVFVGPQTAINCYNSFSYCVKLQKLNFKNIKATTVANIFYYCPALLEFPKIDFSATTAANGFANDTKSLKDTIVDMSSAIGMRKIGITGDTNNFVSGLKGLRVSNQAPFTLGAPQIDVSYTGIDRTALVNLFNYLPTVSGGQIINIVGCTGTAGLTADDEAIATAKGWTITK